MIKRFTDWDERTFDLAVERFTSGLDARDEARLSEAADRSDLEDLEFAIAAIHLAELSEVEAPPEDLLATLEKEGRECVAANHPSAGRVRSSRTTGPSRLSWAGWLVAASLLFVFLFLELEARTDSASMRRELVATASDLVRIDWTATEDPAATGAGGNVVWSSDAQEGYMVFTGLKPNDPKRQQFQLWIFDPTRADWEAKPVDGGVFDVSSDGEVVVPIDAKLKVRETALFAVTLEVPGGVVVSERERLVLTAAQ